MSTAEDCRSRIYARYPTNFKDAPAIFDTDAAWHWGRAYLHFQQSWIHNGKCAAINFDLPNVVFDHVCCALDLVDSGWNGFVFPH